MKKILIAISSLTLLYGCGVKSASDAGVKAEELMSGSVTLYNDEAESMISALFQSGVRDPQGRMGSIHLAVDEVLCNVPVVVDPTASCTLTVAGAAREVAAGPAATLYSLLKKHVARVPTGRMGVDVYRADHVDCQRFMINHGTVRCSFDLP